MSSFVDKVKDTLNTAYDEATGRHNTATGTSSTRPNTDAYGSTNAGPHSSNVANKMDPRVDSDRDGSHRVGDTGMSSHNVGTDPTTGGYDANTGYGNTTAGPHSTNVANKLDPRVDSDRDGSTTIGGAYGSNTTGHREHHEGYGSKHSAGSTGLTGDVPSYGTQQSTLGSEDTGAGIYTRSGTQNQGTSVGYEGHNRTGTTTHGHGIHSQGRAPKTAGPHKSDMMNKMDPRVDSDLDGSKTFGGDKTFSTDTTDTTDSGTTGRYRTGGI
jgi:hypothetical protein